MTQYLYFTPRLGKSSTKKDRKKKKKEPGHQELHKKRPINMREISTKNSISILNFASAKKLVPKEKRRMEKKKGKRTLGTKSCTEQAYQDDRNSNE